MIANESSPFYVMGLLYCEGRNDQAKDHQINSILFAREFASECIDHEPDDVEITLELFYERYRETYLLFSAIVGSEL